MLLESSKRKSAHTVMRIYTDQHKLKLRPHARHGTLLAGSATRVGGAGGGGGPVRTGRDDRLLVRSVRLSAGVRRNGQGMTGERVSERVIFKAH